VVREVGGQGGELTQALYAHMNNKTIKKPTRYMSEKNICSIFKSQRINI
jgi:hypothetical protein